MGLATKWIDRTFYPNVTNNWDDELLRSRVLDLLRPEHRVLDIGAGAGIVKQMNFKGRVAQMCGIDLDPRVVDNPWLDEAKIANAEATPYGDDYFDVVIADNVLEHLPKPALVFSEICRTLKPGGVFLFKTPNKHHYMPTIARLTPHKFHELVNRWRGRAGRDVFPTLYRANSKRDATTMLRDAGFGDVAIELIESRPEYLRMSGATYMVGLAYERAVNRSAALADFRVILIGTARKPGPG